MEIQGKNVFVTGSTRGIGLEIAHRFADLGANVVLNGRGSISQDILEQFSEYGVTVLAVSGDVSQQSDAKRMIAEANASLGDIDILINNAGVTRDKMLLRMSEEDFEAVLKINLTGAFNMTQAVLKPMTKKREGAIVNISSVVGLTGNAGQANYAASKAGLIGFSKSVAREVAARNVRVNVIAPGFIESDMTDVLSDKVKELMLGQIPMRTFGTTRQIADAVVFMASQDYLTGQVLAIDGGISMQ